jgi:hypothetical protein
MPKPQNHTSPNYDTLENDASNSGGGSGGGGGGGNYSIPSPISPRTTRCPSLTNSIYSTSASSSPSEGYVHPKRGSFSSTATTTARDVLRYTHDTSRISKPSAFPPLPGIYHRPHHYGQQQHSEEKLSKHEKRRRNHLNSEKKRRENIKGGMDALFQLVPACRDQQESKANILKKTKEYILELQSTIFSIENECRRLAEENRELMQRAAAAAGEATLTTATSSSARLRL